MFIRDSILTRRFWFVAVFLSLICGLALHPAVANAQTEGNDASEEDAPQAAPPDVFESDIPEELRVALSIPLQKKAKQLREITDENGVHYVRGTFFQRFVRVDDDTYQVIFHKRIAEEEELITERYLVTIGRDATSANRWEITDEKLERRVDNALFGGVMGDETFHAFDSFSFDREGLRVSGESGTMFVDYWRGRPAFMMLMADSLSYDYVPPVGLNYHQISKVLKQKDKYQKDLVFDPERVAISCSGAQCEEILNSSFGGLRETAFDDLDSKIGKQYKDIQDRIRKNRKEYPMQGYRADRWPDRRTYNVSIKRSGATEHWVSLGYDSYAPEEVSFWVSRLGDWDLYSPLFTYYSKETRESGVSAYDLELRPDLQSLTYDVLSVTGTVDMSVEDADTMNCDLTYRLRITKPLDMLTMAIVQVRDVAGSDVDSKRPSMQIYQIEDGQGEELTYIRRSSSAGWVVLPKRMNPGDELEVHLKFVNTNSLFKLNPSYSYVSRSGWMPFVRFGDMIDDFELTIRVPKRYQILGVGHPVSDKIENDLRVARYVADSPVTFPTIIMGDYEMDKPRFAATKSDGTEIPVRIHVDKTSMMSFSQWKSREEAIGELTSGISEIRPDALRPIAEQAANSLNLYREVYGVDYPFKKLDLVNDPVGPGFYGQAPASIIYLGAGVFEATGETGHYGGTDLSRFKESVVAHEVAHQWWGSLVAMGNRRNYWFVESLAEYSSALFVENLYASKKNEAAGRKAYLEKVEEWRRVVLEAASMASVQDVDTLWSGGDFPGQARTAAIYNQGPYAFHILRETFGDEKFFPFLKALAQELQGKEVVTRDIQRVAEESFGGTMEWFFDQWIRGVGIPEYSFNYSTRLAEDGTYVVEGDVKQRIVVGQGKTPLDGTTYRGIITITVIGRDKKEYPVRVLIENEVTPFAFKVPVKPREVVLNKSGEMLAHDVLINEDFL